MQCQEKLSDIVLSWEIIPDNRNLGSLSRIVITMKKDSDNNEKC